MLHRDVIEKKGYFLFLDLNSQRQESNNSTTRDDDKVDRGREEPRRDVEVEALRVSNQFFDSMNLASRRHTYTHTHIHFMYRFSDGDVSILLSLSIFLCVKLQHQRRTISLSLGVSIDRWNPLVSLSPFHLSLLTISPMCVWIAIICPFFSSFSFVDILFLLNRSDNFHIIYQKGKRKTGHDFVRRM